MIISNCVVNLSGDKRKVLAEAFRVLKPGGRFAVSDVVVRGEVPAAVRSSMELWVGCVAGALTEQEFHSLLEEAGFEEIAIEPTRIYEFEDARAFLTRRRARHRSAGAARSVAGSWARSSGPASRRRARHVREPVTAAVRDRRGLWPARRRCSRPPSCRLAGRDASRSADFCVAAVRRARRGRHRPRAVRPSCPAALGRRRAGLARQPGSVAALVRHILGYARAQASPRCSCSRPPPRVFFRRLRIRPHRRGMRWPTGGHRSRSSFGERAQRLPCSCACAC